MPSRTAAALTVLLCALFAPPPASAEPVRWEWPIAGGTEVLRGFDPPARPWLPGHRGVDLAASEAARVHAAGAGRVTFSGEVAGTPVVVVGHGSLRTTYLPVDADVGRGDLVEAGTVLGVLADEPWHCPDQPCLHWGLLRGTDYLDPLSLFGRGQVRLLPVPDRGGLREEPMRSGPRMGLPVGAGEAVDGDMGVDLGTGQRGVAEQLLHAAQVGAPVE